jgi:hypothetical protein
MNPEPFGDPSPDELAAVFAVIEARRSTMTVDETRDTATTEAPVGVWRRPVVAFAGMALLVMLVVGGAALLYGGGDAPVADTAPTTALPSTTELVSPTTDMAQPIAPTVTTVAEPTAADLVSVERVTDDSLDEFGMRIWDLAVGGPGLVAVGEITTPDDEDSVWGGPSRDAVVLVSSDGRSWDRVDDPELFGGDDWDELHAVWSSPVGLIAQGRDAEAPYPDVVWYASTDGINWSLVTDEDLYNAWEREYRFGDTWIEFLDGGPGWVAALYRDTDGTTSSGNATGCVGYPSRECENPALREILVSSDGIDWETTTESLESLVGARPQAPPRPAPAAWDSGDSHYPWSLAWNNDQVVAVRYHAEPKVGVSMDGGETWLQVDPEAFGDGHQQIAIEVVTFGDYYVIGGSSFTNAEVWILEWIEELDT